ncbi:MAG: glycosyltransferase family 4 protein [Bacteroidota bacterium]|nr:glycosyltransferase family 4 protein [Bacteroidota bacterium]
MRQQTINILIFNRCYPPEIGATGTIIRDIAKFLYSRGHKVTIIVGRPIVRKESYYLYRKYHDDGILVIRVGSTSFSHNSMLGRIFNYVTYLFFAFFISILLRPRPNVIVAMTDPPLTSLLGWFVSFLLKRPLVYNIRDLHPDMALAAGVVKSNVLTKIWEKCHILTINKSKLVIAISEDMKRRILSKNIKKDKIVVVRDGSPFFENCNGNEANIQSLIRAKFSFVVGHTGNIGFGGAWDTILKSAHYLRDTSDIGFVFIGDGSCKYKLEKYSSELNIKIFPYFPIQNIFHVMSSPDVHIVTIKHGLQGLIVPSKFYSIIAIGKPVLALVPDDTEISEFVKKFKCGFVIDPEDHVALSKIIIELKNNHDMLRMMSENAKKLSNLLLRDKQCEIFERYLLTVYNNEI